MSYSPAKDSAAEPRNEIEWSRRLRWLSVYVTIGTASVALIASTMFLVGTPKLVAETDNSTTAGVLALAAIFGAAAVVIAAYETKASPTRRYALRIYWNPRRLVLARLRRACRAIGFRAPWTGDARAWVGTAVFAAAYAVFHVLAYRVIVRWFPGPHTAEELVAEATRDSWWTNGWPAHVPGLIVTSGVAAEEIIYRSTLLLVVAAVVATRRHWTSARARAIGSVVVVVALLTISLAFGLMHAEFSQGNAASAFTGGIVLGLMSIWSRSIIPAIGGHLAYNVAVLYLL